jgi:hypothetical protein
MPVDSPHPTTQRGAPCTDNVPPHPVADHDVVWTTPAKTSADLMPLGNGTLGINTGVMENGDLVLYLGRNDSFSEISQLCKVGKLRISFAPNPLREGAPFRQELTVRDGLCKIRIGRDDGWLDVTVFVDADHPVVHLTGTSSEPVEVKAVVESWRTAPQEVSGESVWTLAKGPVPLVQAADVFPAVGTDAVCWYHRNTSSTAFEETVRVQSLAPIRPTMRDPLIHRTFGGWVTGDGFASTDARTLATPAPVTAFHLRVASPCEQTASAEDWMTLARDLAEATKDGPARLERTSASWRSFWDRSWVDCDARAVDETDSNTELSPTGVTRHGLFLGQDKVSAEAPFLTVGKAWTLQRYMQACAGRSTFPIKFNGSLFTVEPGALGIGENPDWRRWGDCYWWQNTRMPYHAMLAAGDFDLMLPLFDFFESIRPFAEARARLYHQAAGAYFAETMTAWGTYANRDYGWDRTGKEPGEVDCLYWRYAWNQGLELVGLMLDYHEHTGDEEFLEERLLPMADSVLKYFDTRFGKDAGGRIVLHPTQSVETYWHEVVNDTPTVAGLTDVTARLCALPAARISEERRRFYARLRSATPPIPMEDTAMDGRTVRRIAVAERYNPTRSNCENPELFPIWPFRLFGLQRPMLEEARNAYALRQSLNDVGWGYDSNAAALLGLTDEAARMLKAKLLNSNAAHRWPATWGPNFDWLPDQCHGGNLLVTINSMLLQHAEDSILVFPAWPRAWDVSFKLHAPRGTQVEATLQAGRITHLATTPPERRKDVIVPEGWL